MSQELKTLKNKEGEGVVNHRSADACNEEG